MTVITDGTTWLAALQPIAFGGYRVVLPGGLAPGVRARFPV